MTRRPVAVITRFAPALLAMAGLVAYAVRLHLRPLEILRTVIGLVALWGPMAALIYLALRREVPQRIPRVTFALIASYALTTLLYFVCCVVWTHWLFYPILLLIAAGTFLLASRGGPHSSWRRRPPIRVDWPLTLLIITSLFLFARYQVPYTTDAKTGHVRIVACLEQTYFVGQAYELARHTPPLQQACQAGVPERAYHLLPHLAAMLTARFAGQSDFMHAHLVYHYAWLTVLMCLALYSIVERLTGARAAGYVAACFLVTFAIPFPPMVASHIGYLYFNLYPIASSLLEPVVVTSPQMYSGLVVAFGVLLGVVLMCRQLVPVATDDTPARDLGLIGLLAMLSSLLVASLCRFRVQVFLPLAPSFMLVLCFLWWRSKSKWHVALAAFLTVAVSALLYLETRWPGYLRGTSSLRLSFAPNHPSYIDDWPGAVRIGAAVRWFLSGEAYALLWPTIATLGFVVLNGVGLPLLAASAGCLAWRRAWREWGGYAALVLLLVLGSLLGSQIIQVGYDSYSVGGQMLLHIGWYLLPFLGLAVWAVASWLMARLRWQPRTFGVIATCVVLAAVAVQLRRGPSDLDRMVEKLSVTMPRNDVASLKYLHDHTPLSAVVLSDHHLEPSTAVYPGIAGRAAYVAYAHGTLELLSRADGPPARSRLDIIKEIWHTTSANRFVELLRATSVTHLVEFSDHPLNIGPRKFLQQVWESPPGHIRVRVFRFVPERWPGPATTTTAATEHTPQGP